MFGKSDEFPEKMTLQFNQSRLLHISVKACMTHKEVAKFFLFQKRCYLKLGNDNLTYEDRRDDLNSDPVIKQHDNMVVKQHDTDTPADAKINIFTEKNMIMQLSIY